MTRSTRFVLVCCCSITALIGTPGLSFAERTKGDRARRAKSDMREISIALAIYATDTGGGPPTQAQGLAALVTKPEGVDSSVWRGPYFEKGIPKDPWGNEYVYVLPGKNSKLGFDLYSLGRDRESATGGNDPDDVNNWDPASGSYYGLSSRTQITARLVAVLVLAALIALRFVLGCCRRKGTLTKESS